jgi:NAD(P)-dependent dehydrogenase (short-subunit alcohol dehydrogenase family)
MTRTRATPDRTARVALVTGAAGGLGSAIVDALEADGWTVAAATRGDGPYAADLADAAAGDDLVRRVMAQHGHLDLLVSNAAAMTMAPVESHPPDEWWHVVEVNLTAPFRLSRAAAPHLRASGGSIVFISSEWGVTGWPDATAYSASKAGLVGLTQALAHELAPDVRVNAIAPGVIDTPQLRVDAEHAGIALDEMKRRYAEATPLRRIASPAEIAASVIFLASAGGAYYTGQVLQPNGGTTMA